MTDNEEKLIEAAEFIFDNPDDEYGRRHWDLLVARIKGEGRREKADDGKSDGRV